MRFFFIITAFFFISLVHSQKKKSKFLNQLSGNFEINSQLYSDDKALGDFKEEIKDPNGENKFRANSYLQLNYQLSANFDLSIQAESYEPISLLNYAPQYRGTNLAQYAINYRNSKNTFQTTIGYFYEQLGSGLLLRTFEERQLGINNSLRGLRFIFNPLEFIQLKAFFGNQRYGLEKMRVSTGKIAGLDVEVNLKNLFNVSKISSLNFGASYVLKNEAKTQIYQPKNINSYAFRIDADFGKFYTNIEYNLKGDDIAFKSDNGLVSETKNTLFDGNAILATLGYSKRNLGISATFRRLENMSFFSERSLQEPGVNTYNLASINYIPALTKQHDYLLTNIYIYNPQPILSIDDRLGQSGEIGGQIDFYYNFKRKSFLGGKYGTKVTANFSNWSLLDSNFSFTNENYSTSFFGAGAPLFSEVSIEVRKKLSKNTKSILTFVNSSINANLIKGAPPTLSDKKINATILVADITQKFTKKESGRIELQHLWSNEDQKNWIAGTLEITLNRKVNIYVNDMWNYGNDIKDEKIHYYNIGGSYTASSFRIGLNYGRQRGGLLCVGGVCRLVSPNTGFTLNINSSF